jgi:hypothetical protein
MSMLDFILIIENCGCDLLTFVTLLISFCGHDMFCLASVMEKLTVQGSHICKPCQWVLENSYVLFGILFLSDMCVYENSISCG